MQRLGRSVRPKSHRLVETPRLGIVLEHPERCHCAASRLEEILAEVAERTANALPPMHGSQVYPPDFPCLSPVKIVVATIADRQEAEHLAILLGKICLFRMLRKGVAEPLGSFSVVEPGQE
ncbi:hypothetical protein LCGC14_1153390 [marine sediment metagenome]|uniref:Uncharacterized protein n=1 Tax=marine sediment metagenome TaxID=412755 RepID=A0A0F9PD09_9ZZZZ